MKNIAFAVLIGILLISGLLAACQGVVFGSGDPEKRTFDYTDFTKIEAHNGFHVEITKSSSFSVEVTTDDNVWEYLDVSKNGDTLVIGFEWNRSYNSMIKEAVITMPGIEGIQLSGGSQGEIEGFNSSDDFSAKLSGGSRLDGTITTGDTDLSLSGGSRVTLSGMGENLIIDSSGGSRVNLEDFAVNDADISISGGGFADIHMDGILNANLSGGSKVIYSGNLELGDLDLSGGSTISKN
ncbi:head GIN domain-containing protein [Chloroflexota bacterium]